MISFRYHLVSIIAVFLALALGIVVGTTALNGPITKDLRRQLNDAKKQRDALAVQVKQLQGEVSDAGQFASTYGAQLVTGTLTGKSVIEIVLPGTTSDMQEGLERQLTASGSKLTGQVTVDKPYLDPARSNSIYSLAIGPVKPSTATLPVTNDAGQLGGALLAFVLTGGGQPTDLTQVLGAFSENHLITLAGNVTPATTFVVLTRGAASSSYAGAMELSLVDQLAKRNAHVVVAGDSPSAGSAGLVGLVRESKSDRGTMSTVDDADNAFGQVSTVLALAAADKGQLGHYGTQEGADALFPAPSK